ncbi:MAG: biotin transporter BioY [Oscillospiraceae bacterium]|nr:biotin transporter BioY [Oscillospiraceae bacterium]
MKHTLKLMLLTALFAALTAVGAFIRIPLGTISFTVQIFFTCMAGILLGPYAGAASQAVYVLLGLLGVPIFTEGGGLMYFAKPTFGFLLGMIPMAFVIGLLADRLPVKNVPLRLGLACAIGLAVLYAVGLPYIYFSLGGAWSIGKTLVSGCLIFLPFDALKIVCASILGEKLRNNPSILAFRSKR